MLFSLIMLRLIPMNNAKMSNVQFSGTLRVSSLDFVVLSYKIYRQSYQSYFYHVHLIIMDIINTTLQFVHTDLPCTHRLMKIFVIWYIPQVAVTLSLTTYLPCTSIGLKCLILMDCPDIVCTPLDV